VYIGGIIECCVELNEGERTFIITKQRGELIDPGLMCGLQTSVLQNHTRLDGAVQLIAMTENHGIVHYC
jgi:hypothetical protein